MCQSHVSTQRFPKSKKESWKNRGYSLKIKTYIPGGTGSKKDTEDRASFSLWISAPMKALGFDGTELEKKKNAKNKNI